MTTERAFLALVRFVVEGDTEAVAATLLESPALATTRAVTGASRQSARSFFFPAIKHYLYAGDTALHMAAAAFNRRAAELLVQHGADCRVANRRGAQPLHYAADTNHWDPAAQVAVIEYLISIGADPHVVDRSGTAPLHRAVRTRSAAAVAALLDGGANPSQRNGSGSTPLHLAVQTTGRGGSGTRASREQQEAIVALLREHGARLSDRDGRGRTILDSAQSDWARNLLELRR